MLSPLPEEHPKAYTAFLSFLEWDGSLQELSSDRQTSYKTMRNWSSKFNWKERKSDLARQLGTMKRVGDPWRRWPGETPKAYQAFLVFVEHRGSLKDLAINQGLSQDTVRGWSSTFQWRQRYGELVDSQAETIFAEHQAELKRLLTGPLFKEKERMEQLWSKKARKLMKEARTLLKSPPLSA